MSPSPQSQTDGPPNDGGNFLTRSWGVHLMHVEIGQCLLALAFVALLAIATLYMIWHMEGFSYGQA